MEAEDLALVGSDPEDSLVPDPRRGAIGAVLDLMRRPGGGGRDERRMIARALWPELDQDSLLVAPLVARDERLGLLCCVAEDRQFTDEDAELLGAVANQTAVGLKKAALIERLTAENIVKDMFDALAAGSVEAAAAKAGEARCDLTRPHLFLHARARAACRRCRAGLAGARDPARGAPAAALSASLLRLPPRPGAGSWRRCRTERTPRSSSYGRRASRSVATRGSWSG